MFVLNTQFNVLESDVGGASYCDTLVVAMAVLVKTLACRQTIMTESIMNI